MQLMNGCQEANFFLQSGEQYHYYVESYVSNVCQQTGVQLPVRHSPVSLFGARTWFKEEIHAV